MVRAVTLIRFTEQGAREIAQSPKRAAEFRKAAKAAGVKVEEQCWLIGAYDGLLILSADDEQKIFRCLTDLVAKGNVKTETLRALDAKEFEAITS